MDIGADKKDEQADILGKMMDQIVTNLKEHKLENNYDHNENVKKTDLGQAVDMTKPEETANLTEMNQKPIDDSGALVGKMSEGIDRQVMGQKKERVTEGFGMENMNVANIDKQEIKERTFPADENKDINMSALGITDEMKSDPDSMSMEEDSILAAGHDNEVVLKAHRSNQPNPIVFFDIGIDGKFCGRLILELFENIVPRTCKNFLSLCRGDNPSLSYKGTSFHRLLPNILIQGGDIEFGDGSGSKSIYGPAFPDENFLLKHESPGWLSMANTGLPDTNGSQFFLTLSQCPHLDGRNVVFGRVKKGTGALSDLEKAETDEEDQPINKITILDCGQIMEGEDLGMCCNDGTPDVYPHHPEDLELDWYLKRNFEPILKILKNIKEAGNMFYRQNDLQEAGKKYEKCTKYISMLRESLGSTEEDEEERVRDVEVPCVLNLAAINIRNGDYNSAIHQCDKIISLEEEFENVPAWLNKAYYRRGQANARKRNFDSAQSDFLRVLKSQPGDGEVKRELAELRQAISEYRTKEKEMFSNIFNKWESAAKG